MKLWFLSSTNVKIWRRSRGKKRFILFWWLSVQVQISHPDERPFILSRKLIREVCTYPVSKLQTYLWKKSRIDSIVWSMLLLQIPSLSRKQGSLTTDSRESCLMMLFSLSVFRFWYISWLRSWRKWLTMGLVGLVGRPPLVPRPWAGLLGKESSQPLARSRQQLQQSRPIGERQSSSVILKGGWVESWV